MMNQFKEKDEVLFGEVQKFMDGNEESYKKVYELSEKYIHKIIYDIVRDEHTTEDMMQETYLQIYNKIGMLKEARSFNVWAGRIASNMALRYLQKYRKEFLQKEIEDDGEFIFERMINDHEAFIPETVLDNEEQQKYIAEILDGLSPEQKLTVQYYYFEEMSVSEIAERMECSEGTVKSRLNYARKALKTAINKFEIENDVKLYSLASLPIFYLFFRGVAEGTITFSAEPKENTHRTKNAGDNTTSTGAVNGTTGSGFLGTLAGKAVIGITVLALGTAAVGVATMLIGTSNAGSGTNQNITNQSEEVKDSLNTENTQDIQEPLSDEDVADILARNEAYRNYLQEKGIKRFAIFDINKDGTKEMLIYEYETDNPSSIVGWNEGKLAVEDGAERPLDGGNVTLFYSDKTNYVLTAIGEIDGEIENWGNVGEGTITQVHIEGESVFYGNTHFYSDADGEWRIYSMTSGEDDLETNKESIIAIIKEKVPNMKKWTEAYEVSEENLNMYLSLDEDTIRKELMSN